MPSILSHPAIPLAIGIGLGSRVISARLLVTGVACSMLPDLDVYLGAFVAAIDHRGVTHSLVFALTCAAIASGLAPSLDTRRLTAFWFIAVITASHGLLDACTNGGSGILLLWPFSNDRYFMPWQVIEVSPLGVSAFLSQRGLEVLASELKWVWPPAFALGFALYGLRRTALQRPLARIDDKS
ncbi:MAG TPA: metal-dependent hydrolase [Burkholderiales bacterium]|nr:metal-dependent hydrolase [Burkholderiales bacterium]